MLRMGTKIFDRIMEIGREVAIIIVIFSMLSISARVVIRYTVGIPINWVVDVSTILQLYLTFLAAAWLLKQEEHISVDIVLSFLSSRRQSFLQVINSIVCALLCAIITVYGTIETCSSWRDGLHLDMPILPPKWAVLIVVPLGSLLLMIQFVRRILGFWRKYRSSAR